MQSKYKFEKIDFEKIEYEEFNNFPDKSVVTTIEWINFINEDSKAKPVIIRIKREKEFIGYFTSLSVVKFGIKIIASPFPGWSTVYMGMDVTDEYKNKKIEIISELIPFLYRLEKCLFIQISDRDISTEMAKKAGFYTHSIETLELGINFGDAALFKNMKPDCRNFIRQFERRGATLEYAVPNDEFAEEYYAQLKDVFSKQRLVTTYSINKVKCLLKNLKDSGNILCLRVRDPEGNSIATSIFPGYNKKFFFWGGASYRSTQSYRPNEYMIFKAIQYWRDNGCEVFDMVGVRDYKLKFGSHEEYYACIIDSKYKILIMLQKIASMIFYKSTQIRGFILNKK